MDLVSEKGRRRRAGILPARPRKGGAASTVSVTSRHPAARARGAPRTIGGGVPSAIDASCTRRRGARRARRDRCRLHAITCMLHASRGRRRCVHAARVEYFTADASSPRSTRGRRGKGRASRSCSRSSSSSSVRLRQGSTAEARARRRRRGRGRSSGRGLGAPPWRGQGGLGAPGVRGTGHPAPARRSAGRIGTVRLSSVGARRRG